MEQFNGARHTEPQSTTTSNVTEEFFSLLPFASGVSPLFSERVRFSKAWLQRACSTFLYPEHQFTFDGLRATSTYKYNTFDSLGSGGGNYLGGVSDVLNNSI